MEIWDKIKAIAAAPFGEELDLVHLFLLVGLILFFVVVWMFILAHIRGAALEVME